MEILSIAETKTSPGVEFNLISGVLSIKGISIPEYPKDFFEPLLAAIDRYRERIQYTTEINIALYYFNSGTARYLLHILRTFKNITNSDGKLTINWYYDDGDADQLETARDIEAVADVSFNFIAVDTSKN